MSQNHFNLNWVGERRLKNAVMVMDWVPDLTQLRWQPAQQSTLTAGQETRLQNALSLLNLNGSGEFAAAEVMETLKSAEDIQVRPPSRGRPGPPTVALRVVVVRGGVRGSF